MKQTKERLTHVLKNRSYAYLWTGQSISLFGLAIYSTCLPFLVFHAGGGAIELGFAHSFFIAPQILFLLASGVFVDRWSRKRIILICDLIRGAAIAVITILLLQDALALLHIYSLTTLLGFLSTFYRPAVRGITPQLVEKDQLVAANSLRAVSQEVSGMIGPVLGGAIVAGIGLYAAYSINALTFFLSALFVSFVTVKSVSNRHAVEGKKKNSFWTDFLIGWQTIKDRAWLGVSILLGSLVNIGIASFDVIILPVMADEVYDGVVTYSWILTSMAVGALICAFIIGKMDKLTRRGILYYSFMAITGGFVLLLSMKPTLWLVLLIAGGIGFCITAFVVIWESAVQALIDEEVLGRVTSIRMFGGLVLLPVGYWFFGVVIEQVGTSLAMVISGTMIIFISATGLLNKRIRELD